MAKPLKPLRVIQVSDCHVSADPAASYRGQSADRNLVGVLRVLMQWKPDLLIVTGDVSEDGSRKSYSRTSALLARSGIPVLALPGNHDEPDVMKEYFPAGPWDGPYVTEMGGWQLILLDSTERGRIEGVLSQHSLSRLDAALQRRAVRPQLVALHHQPVPVGSAWIDRYSLQSAGEFLRVIDRSPAARCVVWGHVHHDFRQQRKGVPFLGAPSSVANSLAGTEKFSLDTVGPACRWLELHANGRVETGILSAD